MENYKHTVESINLPSNYALLVLNIVNVCSKRGAFIPEEFKALGELHEYIKTNLKFEKVEDEKVVDVTVE